MQFGFQHVHAHAHGIDTHNRAGTHHWKLNPERTDHKVSVEKNHLVATPSLKVGPHSSLVTFPSLSFCVYTLLSLLNDLGLTSAGLSQGSLGQQKENHYIIYLTFCLCRRFRHGGPRRIWPQSLILHWKNITTTRTTFGTKYIFFLVNLYI